MIDLSEAQSIADQGDNITYPSGGAARYVRSIIRRLLEIQNWKSAETAPKDGTHILVCFGPYSENWGFDQRPPCVVHYWSNSGEEGFYLSSGIVQDSYNDATVEFSHWRPLGATPRAKT